MLNVRNIHVRLKGFQVLSDVSVEAGEGHVTAILGPNGAGKTSLFNAIFGLIRTSGGAVEFRGKEINDLPPYDRAALGIGYVLESRRVFPYLSVEDNLDLGAYCRKGKDQKEETLRWILDLFPRLRERRRVSAYLLSGGEQQMLAIGRVLMLKPALLMLDEPFAGLAPKVTQFLCETLKRLADQGLTILLAEQDVELALSLAAKAYVLEKGSIRLEGTGKALLENDSLWKAYLGVPQTTECPVEAPESTKE